MDNLNITYKDDKVCIINDTYAITKKGDVYTFHKKYARKQKPREHTNGYLRVLLYQKDYYIHRLVAYCFIDNPHNYKEISHEDNNKKNNKVENLKWCSRSYNNKKIFLDGIRTSEEMRKISLMRKCYNE